MGSLVEKAGNMWMPGVGTLARSAGRLFGMGAYTRSEATKLLASAVPDVHTTVDQGVRIPHKELVTVISSTTPFVARSFRVNPGLVGTFPWLATQAAGYQSYEIRGLVFWFESTSANALNSTNTALGSVAGAFQYNPYADAPTSTQAMLTLAGATAAKPSEDNIFPLECDPTKIFSKNKLVRTGGVIDDLAKYDAAVFYLATEGSQANAVIGKLWVSYDIILKQPILPKTTPDDWFEHIVSVGAGIATNAEPLKNTSHSYVYDDLNMIIVGNTITLPKEKAIAGTVYELSIVWKGTNTLALAAPTLSLGNCSYTSNYVGGASSFATPYTNAGDVLMQKAKVTVTLTNVDVTWTFGTTGVIPANSVWDIQVVQCV